MSGRFIETITGMIVVIGAAIFLSFAYHNAGLKVEYQGYPITANFAHVDGLAVGSDVRIGGIKIGQVVDESLNEKNYQAVVTMHILPDVKIPTDSSAAIVSDGLLGAKYMSIAPGAEDAMLASGGAIQFTQSSVSLEDMIGQMIFSHDSSDSKTKNQPATKGE